MPSKIYAIRDIAQRYLGFSTLEPRNSDRLDFKEVGVGSVREALERAYDAGYDAAHAEEHDISHAEHVLGSTRRGRGASFSVSRSGTVKFSIQVEAPVGLEVLAESFLDQAKVLSENYHLGEYKMQYNYGNEAVAYEGFGAVKEVEDFVADLQDMHDHDASKGEDFDRGGRKTFSDLKIKVSIG